MVTARSTFDNDTCAAGGMVSMMVAVGSGCDADGRSGPIRPAVWLGPMLIAWVVSMAPADAHTTASQVPKSERTAAERKLSSSLLGAIDAQMRGGAVEASPRWALDLDASGNVLVDVRAEVTSSLIRAIEDVDGVVVSEFPQFDSLRARLPLVQLIPLAERSEVRSITPAETSITNRSSDAARDRQPR